MAGFDLFFKEVDKEKDFQPLDTPPSLPPPVETPAITPSFEFPEALADEARLDEVTRVKEALFQAKEIDPGKSASYIEADNLSKELGMPADLVHRNLEEARTQSRLGKLQKILEQDPVLRDWALKDPGRLAKVTPDELDSVSGLGWLFNSTKEAWRAGEETAQLNYLRFLELQGESNPALIARADYLSHKWAGRTFGAESWWEKAVVQTAQMAPLMGHGIVGFGTPMDIKMGARGAGVAVGSAIVLGQAGPQAALPEEIVTIPGSALTGYALAQSSIQQIGSLYNELREITDENGNPIDKDVVRVAALIGGVASGVLDVVALKKVASKIPGLDKALDGTGSAGIKAALRNPTVRAAFANVAKNIFQAGAIEITTEVAQEVIGMATQELAKLSDGGKFEMLTPQQWQDRIADTLVSTAQVMSLVGPLTASPRLISDLASSRRASNAKKILEQIARKASETPIKDKETAQSAVDAVAEGTPAAEVHIPVKELTELFQDEGDGTLYEFGKDIANWNDRVNDAVVSGGDVTLSMGEYYAHIATSKKAKEFADITKLNHLDPITKEVETVNTSMEELTGKLIEQARKVNILERTSQEQVMDAVKQRAQIAGIQDKIADQYATLYSEFFKTMADRTGQDPKELFDKYNLSIENTDVGATGGETYSQRVFHGSKDVGALRESKKFDSKKFSEGTDAGNLGTGVYVTPSRVLAGMYSEAGGDKGGVVDLDIDLRNPLVIETSRDDYQDVIDKAVELGVKEKYTGHLEDGTGDNTNKKWSDEFRDKLKALGHDGVVLKVNGQTSEIVSFDPSSITFAQQKRGSITFTDQDTVIRLFKAQNLSTFIHESGHFFLKVLEDLAKMPDAPEGIKADWETIQKSMGFTGKPTVAAHEKFAKSFEAYLFEGRAPSHKLRQVFQRMRAWLLAVYRHVRRIGEVPSAEIRGVMDRMLASDWAIGVVQENEEFQPLFTDPAQLSPEEWAKYNKLVETHVNAARDDLQYHVLQDMAVKVRGDMAVYKKEVKKQIREQLSNSLPYKTLNLLRKGTEFTRPIRINESEVRRIYGDQVANAMPSNTTAADGPSMTPDEIAELTGWTSGDEMITAMAGLKPLNEAVNEQTTAMVEKKFGDKFAISEMTVSQANQSMHIDKRAEILEFEIRALQKMGGRTPSNSPAKFARELAERKVVTQKIKDISKFSAYLAAERNAAFRADKAIAEKRYADAAEFKRQQLYSHQMGKVAQETLREVDKMRLYAVKMVKKPTKIDPEYVDQIKAILGRFEFTKISLDKLLRRESLLAFITREEAAGNVTTVPEHLINEARRINYKELTVEEFQGIRDAVKNIEHLGKLKYTITVKRKKMQFEQIRDELLTGITLANKARKESSNMSPSKMEIFKEHLEGLDASFLKIEQLVEWLDAGDINGPARRYIWQPLADAEIVKNDMLAEYTAKITKVFESVDSNYMNDRISIPEIGKTFKMSDIYGVALNMGNHSNYDKMKRGEGKTKGGREWTDADVQAIVKNLKKEDWDRIQEIWDHVNSLWGQIFKLQRRLTGVSPKKVEARPVETPYGTYRGGYYPVVYDKRRATDVANREALANETQFPNTYINPTTPHGHTKDRAPGYAAPMSFDLMNMANHLNAVVHDLTHREAVRGVHKLLTDSDIAANIRATLGEKYRQEFTLWTKHLAHERVASEQDISSLNNFVRKLRTNSTLVGIGFRFSTMLAQATGFSSAKEMVSAANLAKGVRMAASHPVETWEFVRNASGEMRHRSDQMDRDVREGILSLDKFRSKTSQIKRFAYYGVAMADRMVVTPVWMAAYHDQMAKTPGDEQAAIAYADRVVRLTQGSGGAKDLARIQRGGEFQKLATMFYSYFSALYSRGRNLTRDASRATLQDVPNIAARALFIVAIPAVLGELLTGRGPEEDENKVGWAAKKMLLYPFMAVPIVRDFVSGITSGQYTATPAARAVETLAKLIEDMGDVVVEAYEGDFDEDSVRKVVKSSLLSAGYVFGLPTGQLSTTVDNIWRGLSEDDLAPRDIFFTRRQ